MLNFPREFPQARQVVLKTNYRCSGEIVEKSQNLIRYNEARYEKDLTAVRSRGTPVEIRGFNRYTYSLETSWLLEQIRKDLAEGCPLQQIAVLFRINVGSRMTVERLMEITCPLPCGMCCPICTSTGWPKI